jgi:hypothetical protein
MLSRGQVIAALLLAEVAIVCLAVASIFSVRLPTSFVAPTEARAAAGPHLVEDGPHRRFEAGAHPALTVDIGYADLTIVARPAASIDVSASSSTDYGALRVRSPIEATSDGETIHVTTSGEPSWSIGDDRMVTVIVPPETKVTVVNAGDIRASGLRAEASFTTAGRGSVTVDDYDAPSLRIDSSDGRIMLHQVVAARLEVNADGRVEGTALQLRDGSVESSGRVSLGFAAGTDALVTAATDDGQVHLSGFAATAQAASASTSGDGDDASSQSVRVGAGSGHLDVHSSDGSIRLSQEG